MNAFIIGSAIRQKREKMGLTQAELAEKVGVTDKAVSKWETGNGIPDIHIAKLIAEVFDVSVTEILDGDYITNKNQSGNLNKVNFYVCPVCGNIAYSVGEMYASCHGIKLSPLKRENDENMSISQSDGELLIKIDSEMSKENYVSFVAFVNKFFSLFNVAQIRIFINKLWINAPKIFSCVDRTGCTKCF